MEDVSALLLGPAGLTREDLEAALPEVPHELHLRLWQAMGFAEVGADLPAFTEADLQALRDAAALRRTLVGDDDVLVALARSMAQALGRLAESHVRLFSAACTDPAEEAAAVRESAQLMARLLDYVWRRHLAAAAMSLADLAAEAPAAVAFVDIVGYTALSRRTDATALERTLERFEDRVQTAAAQHGVRVVKTLGDAVMLTGADVGGLARAVLTVLDTDPETEEPQAHAGLALGPLLPRNGDVYGEPVNIASRLTGIARPGTLLADENAARGLAAVGGVAVKPAGVRSVRGYAHLKTWRVRHASDGTELPAQPSASSTAKTA